MSVCLDKAGEVSDSVEAKIEKQALISLSQEEHGRLSHLSDCPSEARFHWGKGQWFHT